MIYITTVHETLHTLYNEYVTTHTTSNVEKLVKNETPKDASSCNSGIFGKRKVRGTAKFDSFIRSIDTIQHAKLELNVYLEEGLYICDEGSHFDALEWWMQNLKFEILLEMAYNILSILITTVASELAFSAGEELLIHIVHLW